MKIRVKNYEWLGSWLGFMKDYYPVVETESKHVVLTCSEPEAKKIKSGFNPTVVSVLRDNLRIQNPAYEIIA